MTPEQQKKIRRVLKLLHCDRWRITERPFRPEFLELEVIISEDLRVKVKIDQEGKVIEDNWTGARLR